MTFDDLRNLDLRQIDFATAGDWPRAGKTLAMVLLAVLVLGAGYWFVTKKSIEELRGHQADEVRLRQIYETKYKQAVSLELLREQLVEVRKTFEALRRQLPDKSEVANLLVEITQAGLGRGLEFQLFQPGAERPSGFYAELPINIQLIGGYHEFAEFASDVAAFPRIVTFHDLSISPSGDRLAMTGVAKTYRYLEEDEK